MPGPLLFFGKVLRSCGMASGSSSCRSAFLATQQAAASSSGPGSFVLYEPYVLDEAVGSWRKVPIKYGLGSSQLKTRASWWQKLQGARGWCQMRLQAKMATAAVAGGAGGGAAAAEGAGSQHDVEPWLVVLAEKIVAVSEPRGRHKGTVCIPARMCVCASLLANWHEAEQHSATLEGPVESPARM